LKCTSDMGRALPEKETNWPISVWLPECLTSSQDGDGLPAKSTVMSHLPSKGDARGFAFALLTWQTANNRDNAGNKSLRDSWRRLVWTNLFI